MRLNLLALLLPLLLRGPEEAAGEDPQVASTATGAGPVILGTGELRVHFRTVEQGAAENLRYLLHYTFDGGRSWRSSPRPHVGPSPLHFTAPADGRYGFYVTVRDAVGLGETAPEPGTPPQMEAVVDTAPPEIAILRPHPEFRVAATSSLEVEWEVRDAHLGPAPVDVAYSLDGGPWVPLWGQAPARDRRRWLIPFSIGTFRLRVRARDLAGNRAEQVTGDLEILSPSELRPTPILLVPPHSRRLTVPVYYRLQRESGLWPPEELERVRVWYRKVGGDWVAGEPDRDRKSPLFFQAPGDGEYEILLQALTTSGELLPERTFRDAETAPGAEILPHGSVLVDTLEPRIRILEPPAGSRVQWRTSLRIRFLIEEENPLESPPRIRYSVNGGVSWTDFPVTVDLRSLREKDRYIGEFALPLPGIATDGFLLRVSQADRAGNTGTAFTDGARPIRIGDFGEDGRATARDHHLRATVLLSNQDPSRKQDALEHLEAAVEQWEPFAAAHHDLATVIEQLDGGKAGVERSLEHYRRALELEPENLALRFSVIGALLRLSRTSVIEPPVRRMLEREAEKEFRQIRWADLLATPETDEERLQLAEFRRKYTRWRENEFFRPREAEQ